MLPLHLGLLTLAAGCVVATETIENTGYNSSIHVNIDVDVAAQSAASDHGRVHNVFVGWWDNSSIQSGFLPPFVDANTGDTVRFHFADMKDAVIPSSFNSPCLATDPDRFGLYRGDASDYRSREFVVADPDPRWFFRERHGVSRCAKGIVFAVNPQNHWEEFLDYAAVSPMSVLLPTIVSSMSTFSYESGSKSTSAACSTTTPTIDIPPRNSARHAYGWASSGEPGLTITPTGSLTLHGPGFMITCTGSTSEGTTTQQTGLSVTDSAAQVWLSAFSSNRMAAGYDLSCGMSTSPTLATADPIAAPSVAPSATLAYSPKIWGSSGTPPYMVSGQASTNIGRCATTGTGPEMPAPSATGCMTSKMNTTQWSWPQSTTTIGHGSSTSTPPAVNAGEVHRAGCWALSILFVMALTVGFA